MDLTTDTTQAVADTVKRLLDEADLTLETVVDRTGISYGTLHRRLNNVGKPFHIDELVLIGRLLDMSVTAIITHAEAAA